MSNKALRIIDSCRTQPASDVFNRVTVICELAPRYCPHGRHLSL